MGSFRDLRLENATVCQDHTALRQSSMPEKRLIEATPTENQVHRRSNTVSMGSISDGSMVDSRNSPEESFPRDRSQEASDRSIESLRSEISMLERQAEVSELELQSLRKQVVKESKRGHDLSRKVVSLNEERDALQTECEKLKKYVDADVSNQLQMEIENLRALLHEVRKERDHEKDSNSTLRLQLHKTEDSNSELVLAVRDLDEMLEQKNGEISELSSIAKASQNAEEEVDLLKQKISDLSGEIEVYKKERVEQKLHAEQLAVNYEVLKQENRDVSSKLGQNQIEQMKQHNECLEMSAIIKEFKFEVESLENEIKKQTIELSESSDTINQLETQVKSLENELEKQAESFEDDLGAMTRAKVEQEQRAIQAEEALRKTRWNNANAAERLQEEFRRLSVEMASKFDENEKKAMKSVAEANDLRQQKSRLEELLQRANEELGITKDQYEVKLQELSNQTDMKAKQIERMSLELDERSAQVQNIEKLKEESLEAFTIEIQSLKGEIKKLKREKNGPSAKAEQKEKLRDEMEHAKTSNGEQEMLQRWSNEREELKREFDSARKDAEKLQEELGTLRSLKDEKETIIGTLQSEVEKLRAQYNDLKHCLFKVEQENENLRKQVFVLEGDQQKKDEAITSLKKKLKSHGEQVTYSKEVQHLEKRTTEGKSKQSGVDSNQTELLTDVALLMERNKVMERELKEMEERYSEISLKFAEVEGERQQLVMTIRCLKNGKKN
ncbi:uncharacterized protein LOC132271807 isoform X2 [Cornus florida]|nr:uncharacterized protein LOC132271807 isoform X2 [Cornus florida]